MSSKLQCRRCGYRWKANAGKTSEDVRMCPSCKSTHWNETPRMKCCRVCSRYFIVRNPEQEVCQACGSTKSSYRMVCNFCNTEWSSTSQQSSTCPRCGKPNPMDDAMDLWTLGRIKLKYVCDEGYNVIYLWEGDIPVASMYSHDFLSEVGMTAKTFAASIRSPEHVETWKRVARSMYDRRDSYKENIPYFMAKLDLCEFDATVLALHFTGMCPEAISIRMSLRPSEIRSSFDRIMQAYKDTGIKVNDSLYTPDPISYYDTG